jgi:hypothetical protein
MFFAPLHERKEENLPNRKRLTRFRKIQEELKDLDKDNGELKSPLIT